MCVYIFVDTHIKHIIHVVSSYMCMGAACEKNQQSFVIWQKRDEVRVQNIFLVTVLSV